MKVIWLVHPDDFEVFQSEDTCKDDPYLTTPIDKEEVYKLVDKNVIDQGQVDERLSSKKD